MENIQKDGLFIERRVAEQNFEEEFVKLTPADLFLVLTDDVSKAIQWIEQQAEQLEQPLSTIYRQIRVVNWTTEKENELREKLQEIIKNNNVEN